MRRKADRLQARLNNWADLVSFTVVLHTDGRNFVIYCHYISGDEIRLVISNLVDANTMFAIVKQEVTATAAESKLHVN